MAHLDLALSVGGSAVPPAAPAALATSGVERGRSQAEFVIPDHWPPIPDPLVELRSHRRRLAHAFRFG